VVADAKIRRFEMDRARRVAPGTTAHPELRRGIGRIASSTVRLDTVDPVTTEIVRMRCAKHHDCGT
jgi:hypothetical protein